MGSLMLVQSALVEGEGGLCFSFEKPLLLCLYPDNMVDHHLETTSTALNVSGDQDT